MAIFRSSKLLSIFALFSTLNRAHTSDTPRFAGSWSAECSSDSFYATVNDSLLINNPDPSGSELTAIRAQFRDLVTSRHNMVPYTSSAVDVWDALKFLDRADETATTVIDEVILVYGQVAVPANERCVDISFSTIT